MSQLSSYVRDKCGNNIILGIELLYPCNEPHRNYSIKLAVINILSNITLSYKLPESVNLDIFHRGFVSCLFLLRPELLLNLYLKVNPIECN